MKSFLVAATAAIGAALSGSCVPPEPDLILLVTLDTTRADHLGSYGSGETITRNLDGFAAEGVRFAQAQATAPVTLPAHASMFTGLFPDSHGLHYNGFHLRPEIRTVAEILRDNGWRTVGVPAAFPLASITGIGRGFEVYEDLFAAPGGSVLPPETERRAAATVDVGLASLARYRSQKLFIWLHFFDPHTPYAPPFPFSAQFRNNPYSGEIAYLDQEFGRLVRELRESGRWDHAVMLVCGDHGEGLFDHGEKTHANLAYQSTMHVPFLAKAPDARKGRSVETPVSIVDVAPTILDYAGIEAPDGWEGVSLREAIRGRAFPSRDLFFEAKAGALVFGWSPIEGVRRDRWKLIRSSENELYDLSADPGEKLDASRLEGDRVEILAAALDARKASGDDRSPSGSPGGGQPLDSGTLERLASLGYIGASGGTVRSGAPNPRSRIHLEDEIELGRGLMSRQAFEEALAIWEAILLEDSENRFAAYQAAVSASRLGRLDLAREHSERTVRLYPDFVPGVVLLGELWVREGDFANAEATFRLGLQHATTDPSLLHRLALTLLAQKRFDEALEVVSRATSAPDPSPSFEVVRAAVLAARGESEESLRSLERAVANGYNDEAALADEPLLAPLRAVPGYRELVARMRG